MHHGTCVTHVPWCIPGSLTGGGGGENAPGIPGACATRNFTYLARGPCSPLRQWCWVEFEEFDRAVNKWWMERCYFIVSRYWEKSINKCITKPRPLEWKNHWGFNAQKNGLVLGGKYFHPASLVDLHLASLWKIRLRYLARRCKRRLLISPTEVQSQCWAL